MAGKMFFSYHKGKRMAAYKPYRLTEKRQGIKNCCFYPKTGSFGLHNFTVHENRWGAATSPWLIHKDKRTAFKGLFYFQSIFNAFFEAVASLI